MIEEISVPEGFCISREAFRKIIGESALVNELLDRLSLLKGNQTDTIRELSDEMKGFIEGIDLPKEIGHEIIDHLIRFEEHEAYAVRSSATAEDFPRHPLQVSMTPT
jgi:pyruvate,water dikinase